MATVSDRDPGADGETLVRVPEDETIADPEWPVPDEYSVEPDGEGARVVASRGDAAGTRRRFPPDLSAGAVALLVAALLLIPAAIVLVSYARDDEPESAQQADATPEPAPTDGSTGTQPRVRPVPDVTGSPVSEARSTLEDAGFRVRTRPTTSERARGEVLAQAPAASTDAARGQLVVLTVSRGPGMRPAPAPEVVAVPDVAGIPAAEAGRLLRAAGLEPQIRLVRSGERAGTVLSQQPGAGAEVAPSTSVTIVVAKAPPATSVTVPDLRGLTVAAARRELRELGLRSTSVRVAASDDAGTVVGQSPRAGTSLREGQVVRLRVSSGPALVAVPDVVGLDELTATGRLEDAGFRVEVLEEPTDDPAQDGVVVSQEPAGSGRLEKGSVVTLTVARLG
jgi:serine/threonine-protein kinase